MSFCGTPDLNRKLKMRGFGMHCDMLAHMMSKLRREPGIDKTEAGDQYRLFQLTNEERADFTKFAKTLRLLTTEFPQHDKDYWQLYTDTDYNDYEFHRMLDGHSEEAQPIIATLEKVAGGGIPTEEEYKAAKTFLRMLGNRGHAQADDWEGGCF